jgi:uncharacterized protein
LKSRENKTLFDAVFRGDISEIQTILDNGIDVNSVDADNRTPLIHASIDKNIDLVKALIDWGANITIKDFQGMTALHFAAQNYDLALCKHLVENGAEVDAQDDNGNTPLWRAEFESGGSTELQDYLISNGANENLKNNHDVSPKDLRDG